MLPMVARQLNELLQDLPLLFSRASPIPLAYRFNQLALEAPVRHTGAFLQ